MKAEGPVSKRPEEWISSADMNLLVEQHIALLLLVKGLGEINARPDKPVDKGGSMARHPVNIPSFMGSRFQLFPKAEEGKHAVREHNCNPQNPDTRQDEDPDLKGVGGSSRIAGRKGCVDGIADAGKRETDLGLHLISDIFGNIFHPPFRRRIFFQNTQEGDAGGKGHGTEKPEEYHGPQSIGKNSGGFSKAQPDNQHCCNDHASCKAHIENRNKKLFHYELPPSVSSSYSSISFRSCATSRLLSFFLLENAVRNRGRDPSKFSIRNCSPWAAWKSSLVVLT